MTSAPSQRPSKAPRTQPITRSRKGCLSCRARKVKCDETLGVCSNCSRLGLECKWPRHLSDARRSGNPTREGTAMEDDHAVAPDSTSTTLLTGPSAPVGRRDDSACRACRQSSSACPLQRPTCALCRSQGTECEYDEHTSRRVDSSAEDSDPVVQSVLSGHLDNQRVITATATTDDASTKENRSIPPPLYPHSADEISPPTSAILTENDDPLSSRQRLNVYIDAYFSHLHHIGPSFLHRGRLDREIREGIASPILLRIICAATARFLSSADPLHPDGGARPAQWAEEVKLSIMRTLDRFSISKLAALVILVNHEYSSGRIASGWMLVGMATRMAMAMGFNEESSPAGLPTEGESACVDWLEREARRRIMWSAFCLDAFASGGFSEYGLPKAVVANLDLPSPEYNYSMSIAVKTRRMSQVLSESETSTPAVLHTPSDGLSARYVRLMLLRRDILYYTRHLDRFPVKPWENNSEYYRLRSALTQWRSSLPSELALNINNMYSRKSVHELDALVSIHIWYERLSASLSRISIPYRVRRDIASLSIEDLSGAPADWLSGSRAAAYRHICNIVDCFRLLDQCFPEYQSPNWHFSMFAYDASRDQLAYLAVFQKRLNDQERRRLVTGLEAMINVAGRSSRYFFYARRIIRDVIRFCWKHGVVVDTEWSGDLLVSHSVGTTTPPAGPILQKMPFQRRYLHHPQLDEQRSPSQRSQNSTPNAHPSQSYSSRTAPGVINETVEGSVLSHSTANDQWASFSGLQNTDQQLSVPNPMDLLTMALNNHSSSTTDFTMSANPRHGEAATLESFVLNQEVPHPSDTSAHWLPFDLHSFGLSQPDPFGSIFGDSGGLTFGENDNRERPVNSQNSETVTAFNWTTLS